MQIVDQFGRPFERAALDDKQTARLGSFRRIYEEHPSSGLTPAKLARILLNAERGNLVDQHDLFRDMEEKDGHILTEMSKRKGALTGVDWDIVPPEDASAKEKADAEWLKEHLESIDFEDLLFDSLDAIGHGFAAHEIEWRQEGKARLPYFTCRPQSWFTTHVDDPNKLLLNLGGQPEELNVFGWVMHVHRSKSGYVARAGLHRTLAWPYLFKNFSLRDLAEFLEIYGLPLRLGKYPAGATDDEKLTLLRAVMQIGHSAAGIIPDGMAIDFQTAAAGTHDPFEFMVSWCEKTVSKVILGQTLTTQADGKSSTNALGNVHNEVRLDIAESDARQIARTLRMQVLWPMLAINRAGADPKRVPRLVFDLGEAEDLKLYADALPGLVDMGVEIEEEWVRGKLRIPTPKPGAKLLGRQATPPASDTPVAELRTKLAALSLQLAQTDEADTPEQQLQRLLGEATQDALITPIADLVAKANSLEELRDGLLGAYAQMDASQFQVVMATALQAASLAGRYEVLNGA